MSDDQFLLLKAPEISKLCDRNVKQFLNNNAIASEQAILFRFQKLINTIEPFGSFSFSCIFPYYPANKLLIKRQPYIHDSSNYIHKGIGEIIDGVDDNYLFRNQDFYVLMAPMSGNKQKEVTEKASFSYPNRLELNIRGNFSMCIGEGKYQRWSAFKDIF